MRQPPIGVLHLGNAFRAQWWPEERLRAYQVKRLRRLLRFAYYQVPYYRDLMKKEGLSPESVLGFEDLARIPVTTRKELQEQPRERFLAEGYDPAALHSERSSGSSGRPITVYFDSRSKAHRSLTFLRALGVVGFRPGNRLLLVTSRRGAGRHNPMPGWHYASIQDSPRALLQRLRSFAPDFLYGCVTPLQLLAEEIQNEGGPAPKVRAVVTTAETLDTGTRHFLNEVFRCKVFDFYGLCEVGLVGWECGDHTGYHLAEDRLLVETECDGPTEAGGRLVVTSLDSYAMPIVRYDTGDLATLADGDGCRCGRTSARRIRVEGRRTDRIRLPQGRVVSPYRVTCALEAIDGIRRFQVIQEVPTEVTVRLEAPRTGKEVGAEVVKRAMADALGSEINTRVEVVARLGPEAGGKFRVVESRVPGGVKSEYPYH